MTWFGNKMISRIKKNGLPKPSYTFYYDSKEDRLKDSTRKKLLKKQKKKRKLKRKRKRKLLNRRGG